MHYSHYRMGVSMETAPQLLSVLCIPASRLSLPLLCNPRAVLLILNLVLVPLNNLSFISQRHF